ncbi:MAG: recombinase zinc ribbon domain-containing protein [Solirubrobacteraceae bacterium]
MHEPIVSEELFDRVQEVRSWRTRVVKPGRPSEEYLLRKLLCCERCGARMHGCRSGREGMRRYQCSTRRHHGDCEQKMVAAQPLEEQLIDWLHDFQPDPELRRLILDTINGQTSHSSEDAERRRELTAQLERLRELYVMGDLTKSQYVMRRQVTEEELQRTKPPADPDLDRAQKLLGDFARFWEAEPEPAERRKLLLSLFAQVWAKDGAIVAVKPNTAFARYFTAASEVRAKHSKDGTNSEATKAEATGLDPAL